MENDIGDCIGEAGPYSDKPVQPYSVNRRNRHTADHAYANRMSSAPPNLQRPLLRWALLAAVVLCFGQSVGAAHLHLDAPQEDACTLCAISEPGQVSEVGQVRARTLMPFRTHAVPVFPTALAARLYEAPPSRAPPVS